MTHITQEAEIADAYYMADALFKNACNIIDDNMTEGYAQKNPALVSSVIEHQIRLISRRNVSSGHQA